MIALTAGAMCASWLSEQLRAAEPEDAEIDADDDARNQRIGQHAAGALPLPGHETGAATPPRREPVVVDRR